MICITNPPFKTTLYLKILKLSSDLCKDVICFAPSHWLEKHCICRKIGKYRTLLNGRVAYIKKYSKEETKKYFGIGNAIYGAMITSSVGKPLDLEKYGFESEIEYSVYKKVNVYEGLNKYFQTFKSSPIIRKYKSEKILPGKIYVPIYTWHIGKTAKESILRKNPKNCFIYFNTLEEAENFKKSLGTTFMNWFNKHYILAEDGRSISVMIIARDYRQKIDDEYFYKAFNFTEEEIKYIEESI